MGYTHYWYRPETLDAQRFAKWAEDVRRIIDNLPTYSTTAGAYYADAPLLIKGGGGTGKAEITGVSVMFNGEALTDLDHETFYIDAVMDSEDMGHKNEQGWYFAFCKTARKPYDLAVTASLIRLAYHFPEGVEIRSDGDTDDWAQARELCESLFGFALIPFQDRVQA